MTHPVMSARIGRTFVDFGLALMTRISARTDAVEATDSVDTLSTVQARLAATFIDIRLTDVVIVTSGTVTSESVHLVPARPTVSTRIRFALVYVSFTQNTWNIHDPD